jgi:hypothetical protein
MKRKTIFALVLAGGVVAGAVALVSGSPMPLAAAKREIGIAYNHTPRYVTGRAFADCLAEPVECGLVVW